VSDSYIKLGLPKLGAIIKIIMESIQHQPKTSFESLKREVISTSRNRLEAAVEMGQFLEERQPDFEAAPRSVKVEVLHNFLSDVSQTVGDTSEPVHNENRFLADVVETRLVFEKRALEIESKPQSVVYH
jgi:hypothetical protein